MYYGREPERPPRWWEEAWVLTRVVFGVLFWPVVALIGLLIGIVLLFTLWATNPLLGLAALVAVLVAGWLLVRWLERRQSPHSPP